MPEILAKCERTGDGYYDSDFEYTVYSDGMVHITITDYADDFWNSKSRRYSEVTFDSLTESEQVWLNRAIEMQGKGRKSSNYTRREEGERSMSEPTDR